VNKRAFVHPWFAAPIMAGALCLFLPVNSAAQHATVDAPATAITRSPAPAQKSFATANEAANALLAAAQADDVAALLLIFGEGGQGIVTSGDPAQEESPLTFRRSRKEVHEASARRIGSNELDAIRACSAFVGAQYEYAAEDHNSNGVREYAQNLISSPGTKDGLFWPGSADDPVSPLSAGVTKAIAEGYTTASDEPVPYRGYYFKILKAQGPRAPGGAKDYLVRGLMIGGFGLVAWPAEYGVSGIKTFLVNQDGLIYEKDLGTGTANIAQAMMQFNPDKTWHASR
jgi:hypothetical protein